MEGLKLGERLGDKEGETLGDKLGDKLGLKLELGDSEGEIEGETDPDTSETVTVTFLVTSISLVGVKVPSSNVVSNKKLVSIGFMYFLIKSPIIFVYIFNPLKITIEGENFSPSN